MCIYMYIFECIRAVHGTVQNATLTKQGKTNLQVALSQANYTVGNIIFQTSDDPVVVFKAIFMSVSFIMG